MKKKAWLLFLIVPVALVALILLIKPAAPPSAASAEPRPRSKPAVDTDALMARVKAQSDLAASASVPGAGAPAGIEPVPDVQEELRTIDA